MIRTFQHKGLAELFETGRSSGVRQDLIARARVRLAALDQAKALSDLNLPGFRCHPLQGHSPTRYAITVNGPWRITFEWDNGNVYRVDFEQYH